MIFPFLTTYYKQLIYNKLSYILFHTKVRQSQKQGRRNKLII